MFSVHYGHPTFGLADSQDEARVWQYQRLYFKVIDITQINAPILLDYITKRRCYKRLNNKVNIDIPQSGTSQHIALRLQEYSTAILVR